MSFDKAILHGKEHRKPYTGSQRYFRSCRNHGSCPWCERDRKYKFRDKHFILEEINNIFQENADFPQELGK